MKFFVLFILLVGSAFTLFSGSGFWFYTKQHDIVNIYKSNNINGSLLIESLDGKVRYEYNVNTQESFVPASTFKIPNTLIILEEGFIKNQFDIIKWDGKQRVFAAWNKDQTLKTAFQHSCVWCYQRYAIKVGNKKYLEYLKKFNYGNLLTGSDVTRFWLDGELKISVLEQLSFLRKVYSEELPIQKIHIKTLKNIMLSEENESYKIWSKTGWSGKDGWYVGYLVKDNQTWFFANHIEINQNADLKFRKILTIEAFKALSIIQ